MSLISDPLKWTESIVSSWVRFWAFSAFIFLGWAYTVYLSATEGWRAGLSTATFLACLQVMLLYALRRLYLNSVGEERPADDGLRVRRHYLWLGLLLVGVTAGMVLFLRLSRAL